MSVNQAPNPERESLSVVFLGSFNPRIFHPVWFEREGLTRPGELAAGISSDATDLLVTPDLSRCEIGPEVSIECLSNRLALNAATTLGEERLRELATGIILKLPHIPISAVGLNSVLVYEVPNHDDWHRIGDILAPKAEIWEPLMEGRPGMSVLRIEDFRPGPPPVRVWATVEPVREPHPPYRFQIHINWHGDIQPEPPEGASATEMASRFMVSEWDKARDFGAKLADKIFAVLHHSIP
ncbi:MAG: hypothetical protein NTW21_20480 [Verrucomicrobia bacterium]|nr:hypothetical protein [Verrucomicrobiota bacterium]